MATQIASIDRYKAEWHLGKAHDFYRRWISLSPYAQVETYGLARAAFKAEVAMAVRAASRQEDGR